MIKSGRRTGRTTNMLLAAMAFAKRNQVIVVAANEQQIGNLKHHYEALGGDSREIVFLNGAAKKVNYERTRGMMNPIILNDHYAVETGDTYYGEMISYDD